MSDVDSMFGVFGDPEVMRFSDGVKTHRWVRGWVRNQLEDLNRGSDRVPLAIDEKIASKTIGYCGLFHYPDVGGQPETEIGYRLTRAHWGRGYATEAVRAVRDYAFTSLGIPRLVAMIDPTNTASINVARKAGFRYEKDVMCDGYTYPDRVYVYGRRTNSARIGRRTN